MMATLSTSVPTHQGCHALPGAKRSYINVDFYREERHRTPAHPRLYARPIHYYSIFQSTTTSGVNAAAKFSTTTPFSPPLAAKLPCGNKTKSIQVHIYIYTNDMLIVNCKPGLLVAREKYLVHETHGTMYHMSAHLPDDPSFSHK